jgi:hypothetical protein
MALELRFSAAGLQLLPDIRALHAPDKLVAILDSVRTATTPEELRRLWE